MSTTVPRAEVRAVSDFLARVRSGPAALVVEGEAGIGKSTLMLSAVEVARSQGFLVLSTRGSTAEVEHAFAAVSDLLAGIDEAFLDDLPSPQRSALDRVRDALKTGFSGIDERVVARAFGAAVGRLSARSPVLLAVDDVQWLDASSRAVIGFTARRLAKGVGLLATIRVAESHLADVAQWLTFREPAVATTRIRMAPLKLDGVHELVAARWGRTLPRPALERVHRISGGNPMFALELARAELDTPGAAAELPDSLSALVGIRLQGLDDDAYVVLLAAACSASPTTEELCRVTMLPAQRVVDSIEASEELGVAYLHGHHLRFAHPLYANGVLANASPARRRATHRALAGVVADRTLRARHLALAATASDPANLAELDSAVDALAGRGALAAAAELIDVALARGGDSPQRRIRSAELHFRSGSIASARTHLHAVLADQPPGVLRALALAHLGAVQAYDDDLSGAVESLSAAADEAADLPALRLVCLVRLSLALAIADRMVATIEHAQRAIALAEELDEPGLHSQALAIWVTATFIWGGGVDRRALQLAVQLEDPRSGATTFLRARAVEAVISAYVGNLEIADAQIRALRHDMSADGSEVDLVWVDNRIAAVAIWAGRYDDADRAARAAVQRAEQLGGRLSCAMAWTKRAAVAAFLGRVNDVRADAHAAIEAARAVGARRQIKEPSRVLAFLEVSLGAYDAALTVLRPMLDEFRPPHELEIEGGEHLPDAIEALAALAQLEEAAALVDALELHGADRDRPWMMAVGARGRATVLAARGDLPAALGALERAMAHHVRLAMPFEEARTQLLLGQLQRRRRQRGRAATTLAAALSAFEALGTPLWAERARRELARLSGPSADGQRLTPSERRTAVLAAQGLSNREIATELFLAEKTVESALSNVYRKLNIRSRAGLAAALVAAGMT